MTPIKNTIDRPVDAKGRFIWPSAWIDLIEEGVSIFRGYGQNLIAVPMSRYDEFVHKMTAKGNQIEKDQLKRYFLHYKLDIEKTGAVGRITLSKELMKFAGIEPRSQVTIAYMGDKFEITESNRFREMDITPEQAADLIGRISSDD